MPANCQLPVGIIRRVHVLRPALCVYWGGCVRMVRCNVRVRAACMSAVGGAETSGAKPPLSASWWVAVAGQPGRSCSRGGGHELQWRKAARPPASLGCISSRTSTPPAPVWPAAGRPTNATAHGVATATAVAAVASCAGAAANVASPSAPAADRRENPVSLCGRRRLNHFWGVTGDGSQRRESLLVLAPELARAVR